MIYPWICLFLPLAAMCSTSASVCAVRLTLCSQSQFLAYQRLVLTETYQGAEDPAGFAPSFIEKPRIIPNETGTLITMKCKCRAKPKPDITWYRATNVIKESSKISLKCIDVQEDIYELTLELKVCTAHT